MEEIFIKNHQQISSINEDYLFKIIVLGDCAVGKSNILSKYSKNIFNKSSKSTIGVELVTKFFRYENKIIKVNIWDTAGQERFTSMITTYYKGAKGALLVYDITRKNTFDNIDNWLRELISINTNKISVSLIGNKNDLSLLRQVSKDKAQEKAKKYGMKFYETSALDSSNIKLAFEDLIKDIYIKTKNNFYSESNQNYGFGINLNTQNNNEIKNEEGICRGCNF
jgi:Ras-related protein Rab-11A